MDEWLDDDELSYSAIALWYGEESLPYLSVEASPLVAISS